MVATGCEVSPDGDHDAALADLLNFMTPAPIREIEAWLAVPVRYRGEAPR